MNSERGEKSVTLKALPEMTSTSSFSLLGSFATRNRLNRGSRCGLVADIEYSYRLRQVVRLRVEPRTQLGEHVAKRSDAMIIGIL